MKASECPIVKEFFHAHYQLFRALTYRGQWQGSREDTQASALAYAWQYLCEAVDAGLPLDETTVKVVCSQAVNQRTPFGNPPHVNSRDALDADDTQSLGDYNPATDPPANPKHRDWECSDLPGILATIATLLASGWSRSETADILHISDVTLWRRCQAIQDWVLHREPQLVSASLNR